MAQPDLSILTVTELEAILRASPDAVSEQRVYDELAWKMRNHSPVKGMEYARKSLLVALSLNDQKAMAASYNLLGIYYKNQGKYAKAAQCYEEALNIRLKLDDPIDIASSMNSSASIYRRIGEYELALLSYNDARKKIEEFDLKELPERGKKVYAKVLGNIGTCQKHLGNYAGSLEAYRRSLKIMRDLGNTNGVGENYNHLGALHEIMTNIDSAQSYYQEAISIFLKSENIRGEALAKLNLGNILVARNDFEEGLILYRESLKKFEDLGSEFDQANVIRNIGLLYQRKGDIDSAAINFEFALRIFETIGSQKDIALTLNDIAMNRSIKGQKDEAIQLLHQGLLILDSLGTGPYQLILLENIAREYSMIANFDTAFSYNKKASALREQFQQRTFKFKDFEKALLEQRLKTENALAEKELETAKLETARIINTFFFIGIIVLLILIFLVWRIAKSRRKALIAKQERELKQKRIEDLQSKQKIAEQKLELGKKKIDDLLYRQEIASKDALLKGQFEERQRISQDLHDDVKGDLATILLNLQGLEQETPIKNSSKLALGIELLNQTIINVRRITHDLKSFKLDKFGLKRAIQELVEGVEKSSGISTEFISLGLKKPLEIDLESDVYNIIKELIANALKHAEAKNITVQVIRSEDSLDIMVEDDGKGFNSSLPKFQSGIGLSNIQLRVDNHDGEFWIDSTEDEGTTCCVNLPLKEKL